MKVVIQRSKEASVKVLNKSVGRITSGLVVLVGFTQADTDKELDYMADKIVNLRIFDDENGVMNKSLLDTNKSILLVSQFTLYGDVIKGRRPSYKKALESSKARVMYEKFIVILKSKNIIVETGIFQADMEVSLINDGPVTIIIEK